MQKTRKTARRSCFFIENCQKQHFACKRRAKNDENSLSLVFFHQKLPKTAFRLRATSEKQGKLCFGASRKVEIQKNNVSGCPDELFFVKMNRRGVPKPQNFGKQAFGEPRSLKILKNKLSGCPEARKIWKAAPRGTPKHENDEKKYQINNFQTMGVSPNSRTSFADYKEILEAVDVRCLRTLVLHLQTTRRYWRL